MKRQMISTLAMTLALAIAAPAVAQDFNYTPGWSNTQNFNRLHERGGSSKKSRQKALPGCTIDLVSSRDRRRMEAEYNRIVRTSGSRKADAWAQQQGKTYARQMRKQGLCR